MEGTKELHKLEIEVASWRRQHGEIKSKQLQWEARDKSLVTRQAELEAELQAMRETLFKTTQNVEVHAAERASLQRVIRNQEATIALLGDQQENLKHTIANRDEQIAAPEPTVALSAVEATATMTPAAEQKLREQVQELKKHLAYYQGLCEKQKEYIVRMETSAQLAARGVAITQAAAVAATAATVAPETIEGSGTSTRQYALTLEKLKAAEIKAQYWQELAQKTGVKNASAFAGSPVSPRKVASSPSKETSPVRPKFSSQNKEQVLEQPEKKEAEDNAGCASAAASEQQQHQQQGQGQEKEPQATVEQLEELAELRHRLKMAQGERERMAVEMSEAKDTMKREYTSLWAAVQDLNKLDATKEKAIGTLLDEKLKSDRKLTRAQMQYQKLQDELAALDEDLLSTARKEGILTSLNEEKTPILAKKLKFGDGGPSSVSPVTAMPPCSLCLHGISSGSIP